jgi:hypothetical protein
MQPNDSPNRLEYDVKQLGTQVRVFRKKPEASIFKAQNTLSPKRRNLLTKLHNAEDRSIQRAMFSALGEFIHWI